VVLQNERMSALTMFIAYTQQSRATCLRCLAGVVAPLGQAEHQKKELDPEAGTRRELQNRCNQLQTERVTKQHVVRYLHKQEERCKAGRKSQNTRCRDLAPLEQRWE